MSPANFWLRATGTRAATKRHGQNGRRCSVSTLTILWSTAGLCCPSKTPGISKRLWMGCVRAVSCQNRSSWFRHSPELRDELGSSRPAFGLVGLYQLLHRSKTEVGVRLRAGINGCAETLLAMPAVDPARSEAMRIGRLMIVEQAFGGVQDIALANSVIDKPFDHIFEVSAIGLV